MGWVTPAGRDLLIPSGRRSAKIERPEATGSRKPCLQDGRAGFACAGESRARRGGSSRLRRSSIISHLAVAAATDAAASARNDPGKVGANGSDFAASDGGVVYTRRFYADLVEHGEGSGSPLLFPETVYNAPASHIAARLGLQGEVLTLVGDAAAGSTAIRTGCELLAAGEADFAWLPPPRRSTG